MIGCDRRSWRVAPPSSGQEGSKVRDMSRWRVSVGRNCERARRGRPRRPHAQLGLTGALVLDQRQADRLLDAIPCAAAGRAASSAAQPRPTIHSTTELERTTLSPPAARRCGSARRRAMDTIQPLPARASSRSRTVVSRNRTR